MAGIERRIENLERSFGTTKATEGISEEKARLIEELRTHLPEFEERMAREEAEGNPARRIALEELKARILARQP